MMTVPKLLCVIGYFIINYDDVIRSRDLLKSRDRFFKLRARAKTDSQSCPKFHEESEFDIFEGQGPSRDPLKRSCDQKSIFLFLS